MLDGKVLIEIRKVGFENKGAELMLHAVLEQMKGTYPDARFVMAAELRTAPYEKRIALSFYQKIHIWRKFFQFGRLASFIPGNVRKSLGIVLDKEIDIVIDAAGFSYGDQLGKYSCMELANACKIWKKNGTKIILLPQAFGPFKGYFNRRAMKTVVNSVDLIFARESVSYEYITGITGERRNLKQAPDFTNLVEGVVPDYFDTSKNRLCIVPNYRMIDKTTAADSGAYLPFMIEVTRYIFEKGQKPFILVHEGKYDLILAQAIRDAVSPSIEIVIETDPVKIKGIIGSSEGMIGSRFHGLVSALSQGVPALATGWSHKYQMLFNDYKFDEGILDVHMPKEQLHQKIDLIINDTHKVARQEILRQRSRELKMKSIEMWSDVIAILSVT